MKRFIKNSSSYSEIAETKKSRPAESAISISQDRPLVNKPEQCNKEHDHLKHLEKTFDNLRTVVEWSISGEARELPMDATLEIDGYGSVALPLRESQANEFVTHFKRTQTNFEINDKSNIKIHSPNWQSAFERFINRVKKGLGTSSK